MKHTPSIGSVPISVKYDSERGVYILCIDASLYAESDCKRYVFYTGIAGYTSATTDYKQEYGTGFHKGMKLYRSGRSIPECVAEAQMHYIKNATPPEDDFRQAGHLGSTVLQYTATYARDTDVLQPSKCPVTGELLLEKNFAIPYMKFDGVEVLLCGTIDFKGMIFGQHVISDYKTTAAWDIQDYLDKAYSSPQLKFYKNVFDFLYPGSDVGVMLDVVFLGRTGKVTCRRSDVITHSPETMEWFRQHLLQRVTEIVMCFKTSIELGNQHMWLPNHTRCDKLIAKCRYFDVCNKSNTAADREFLLSQDYVVRRYDPLSFQKD